MANKDHTLDQKIIDSARAEFLKNGYQRASLHTIATNAGTTTGALYTRYKNKDELFSSLLSNFIADMRARSQEVKKIYFDVQLTNSPEKIISAVKRESEMYLNILFDKYDDCVLLICKSDGSSVARILEGFVRDKAKNTIDYLKKIAKRDINYDGIDFIITEQFRYYRLVLERGYDKEKAVACMKTVENFLEAGWKSIFQQIL